MGMTMHTPENVGRYSGVTGTRPMREANIWLRLTSYGANWDILSSSRGTLEERELVRRSRLASWLILGLLVLELVLIPAGLTDPATLLAVLAALTGTVVAAVFNRFGKVAIAAVLLTFLTWGGVLGAVLGAKAGALDTIYLPAYDLLVIPLAIAATLLRPAWLAFVMMAINIATMIADFLYQPKVGDLAHQLANGSDIISLLARPIALQIIVATITFLVVQSSERAIRRADRAEELAELERRELERTRELEEGVRQLLAVHVHLANGDFNVRSPAIRNSLLWQIGSSLNNLIARLGRLAQADFVLQRTQEEANRVAEAIYTLNSGRQPIWPAPSNTPLDRLVDVLRASLAPRMHSGRPQGPAYLPPTPGVGYPGWGRNMPAPNSMPGIPNRPSMAYPDHPSMAYPDHPSMAYPDWPSLPYPERPSPAYPNRPSMAYPASPQTNHPAPDWTRSLLTRGGGIQTQQRSPATDLNVPVADPAGAYGAPANHGYAQQPAPSGVNPWALGPNEPLSDNDLPEWLRQADEH